MSVFFELLPKITELSWQEPGLREVLVVVGEPLEHSVEIPGQMVLPCKCVHAWKGVDLLVRLHFVKSVNSDPIVSPQQIPFLVVSRLLCQRFEI